MVIVKEPVPPYFIVLFFSYFWHLTVKLSLFFAGKPLPLQTEVFKTLTNFLRTLSRKYI